jgi:carbon monoxide dehydrogenase subunit G
LAVPCLVSADATEPSDIAMSLTMNGEFVLPADKSTVWAKLNDPAVLKACIPGCEEFEVSGENEFKAVAKVKLGPVSTRFRGTVTLSEIDAPNSYRISGQGDGGISGFAKGGAAVRLEEADGGQTKLIYDVDAQVGGKIAQLGSRLIAGVAKKNADEFFTNFAAQFSA